jgi:hypothetical protein
MTNKKLNAVQVWKDIEDLLAPRLKLTVYERVVYSHLLRHSRLEGKTRICFSILRLMRSGRFTRRAARKAMHTLHKKGALRLEGYTRAGQMIEVRLPSEILAPPALNIQSLAPTTPSKEQNLENLDFMSRTLKATIHSREAARCFYCLRVVTPQTRCLDHVVPQVHNGSNSYRNLVSVCLECNGRKSAQRAEDFLRLLFREGRLNSEELSGRLRALEDLASGELRPQMQRETARETEGRA